MSSFTDTITDFSNGALDDELTAALGEVVDAVKLTGKTGTVGVVLKISSLDERTLTVEAALKVAAPRHNRTAVFFATDEGLSRRDPNQPSIPGTESIHDR